ncbi:MAG: hypothetical protein LBU82_07150, partial [Treponema sp.]|nr:hypothetical protein [Treponema sp.]
MKKKVIFAVVFALSGWFFSVSAQDMIILKDGAIIDAKVMEIYPAEIRYKRADNLDGPMFIIPASSVLSIRYKNGTTDIINAAPSPAYAPAVPVPAPAQAASAARPPAPAPALSTARAPANAPAPAPTPAPTPATARATPPPASPPGPSADQRMAEQIASAAAGQIADQLGGAGGSQNFIQEPLLMILNSFPALPIAGNNLKFVFESERWTATVNSENYLAGNIEAEETDNGYLLKLSQTHIWPGAVGKSAGRIARLIPGGGAASSVLN